MANKQGRIFLIVLIPLYLGKLIYFYMRFGKIDYFDIGLTLLWIGLLIHGIYKKPVE
jgi:hypothetical protein